MARLWDELGRPCARRVVGRAERYAASRRDAFDARSSVLVHGDAHASNVLEDPTGEGTGAWKLIDPEGMRSEPAHDLAIPLRDWTGELLAGEPLALGLRWCRRLGEAAGVAPQPIWEWAFVERVSTGLFLLQLGHPEGQDFLRVAEAWAGGEPAA